MRFPGVAASTETRWQVLVLDHLRLREPEIIVIRDELDALGPAATEVLRRHGVRWPGNAYMHMPVIELARGGTLLTGVGGDEVLSTRSPRRSLRQLAVARLPARLREEAWLRRRAPQGYGWLTVEGRQTALRALARDEVRWPYSWDRALHHWYASRAFAAVDGGIAMTADGHDVRVVNPLLDRQVLAEFARAGGRTGFPSRTEAMRRLFGELLPETLLSRPTKAGFAVPVWGPSMRQFVANWRGEGVDDRLVDVVKLRVELAKPEPDFRTILLLHQAWLHAQPAIASTS